MTPATRVLIVEDHPESAEMLTRRLVRRGFAVVTATNGMAALQCIQQQRPDVILMDVSLPVIDGLEITRRLKHDGATRGIPVIALTAHAMCSDRDRARAAGCDEFETKPVQFVQLLAKVDSLLADRSHGADA